MLQGFEICLANRRREYSKTDHNVEAKNEIICR